MSVTKIRRARPTLSDAQDLLAVEAHSLEDSGYAAYTIAGILSRANQRAYLAYTAARPAGFCSCFVTTWRHGPQLEIDMLGVLPGERGRGVATVLVRRALEEAHGEGIDRARAVVRVGNGASEAVFRRAAFAPDAPLRDMYALDLPPHGDERPLPEGWCGEHKVHGTHPLPEASLVLDACGDSHDVWLLRDEGRRLVAAAETQQVQTLSYAGLWLEALWVSAPAALAAQLRYLSRQATESGLDEVGYLAPALVDAERVTLRRLGWIHVGRYRYWRWGHASPD